MKYYILSENKYINKNDSNKGLEFLYKTKLGRILLKIFTSKFISNICAYYMNSKLSLHRINKFIKNNNILMDDYKKEKYKSFNNFFIRNIKPGKRKFESGFTSICDAKLSAYKIDDDSSFKIKNSIYTVDELVKDNAKNYNGGYALIFRLTPDDYHHYCFPDDGKIVSIKKINGILHTVQPLAFKKYKVFNENTRVVSLMNCKNYGKIYYIEVGAMLIGKITNRNIKEFSKGEEKGYFEFGGSTIVLLVEKDKVKINKKITQNTENNIETIVKMGQNIE